MLPAGGAGTRTSWHHCTSERAASSGPPPAEGPTPTKRSVLATWVIGRASAAIPGHAQPAGSRQNDCVASFRATLCPSPKRIPPRSAGDVVTTSTSPGAAKRYGAALSSDVAVPPMTAGGPSTCRATGACGAASPAAPGAANANGAPHAGSVA